MIIVTGESKNEMLEVMEKGIEHEKTDPFLPESVPYISGAEYTLNIIRQAPVVIFITNYLFRLSGIMHLAACRRGTLCGIGNRLCRRKSACKTEKSGG